MINLLKYVNKELKQFCTESYLDENTNNNVTYPYLVYTLTSNDIEYRDEIYIDIDIFDKCGSDKTNLETIAHNIKQHFKRFNYIDENICVIGNYVSSHNIPTLEENIKRKYIQLNCRVDFKK